MAPKQSGGDGQWLGRHRLSLLELRLIQSFLVFQIIVFSNRANYPTEMSVLQYAFTSRCIESWSYMGTRRYGQMKAVPLWELRELML